MCESMMIDPHFLISGDYCNQLGLCSYTQSPAVPGQGHCEEKGEERQFLCDYLA